MTARPAAVIAHGSGSSADFVERAFGRALRSAGYDLVTCDDSSGDGQIVADRLARLAGRHRARLVGGISLGAHAAAWVAAAQGDLDGVLLALPAWTGPPGATAALAGQAAQELARDGLERTLRRLSNGGWVGAELIRAWSGHGQEALVAALRRTAASSAPALDELAKVAAPAGIVAFVDDLFHPLAVAEEWRQAIPRAALRSLRLTDAAADRGVIGDRAVDAWRQALEQPQRAAR